MLSLLVALQLTVAPGFIRPVEARVHLSEASDAPALAALCKVPGVQVELSTRSNMLSPEDVEALRRCARPLLDLRLPVTTAQREQLARLPGAELSFELTPGVTLGALAISRLGPRRIHVRIHGALTAERAADLSRLRDVELVLDLRDRLPTTEELWRFRALGNAARGVRLGRDVEPAVISALAPLHLARVELEAGDRALSAAALEALDGLGIPVCVALTWPFDGKRLEPLTALHRLSLETDLGTLETLPRALADALGTLAPPPPGAAHAR